MIEIPLREKYRTGGTAKRGQTGGGNDQGTKHLRKRKLDAKAKAALPVPITRRVLVLREGRRHRWTNVEAKP